MGSRRTPPPILVTGVPRSGTTWLARLLASSPRTSMPGREPMNPRGRQFRLAGHLDAWVRREAFNADEAAVLRRCYSGREPRTFSRYGIRQWAAPLGSTRIVIKDPFAVLSIAGIHAAVGVVPVLVYRHPGAVLASYRRMGWTADTEEFTAIGAPLPSGPGDLEGMVMMWKWCHQVALADLARIDEGVVVSHHALTVGGVAAHRTLRSRLGLADPGDHEVAGGAAGDDERREGVLHDFSRSSASVDSAWQKDLSPEEVAVIESSVADVWQELEARQITPPDAPTSPTTEQPTIKKEST